MNLGLENFRELIEKFLGNTGGRRGRDREAAREAAADEAGGDGGFDGDAETEPGAGEDAESDTDASTATTFEREPRPDPDELDEDEVVDDLYHRIENLEDDLEQKGNQLGSIQDSTQHVSSQVEDVNDTIRQLLGIYDRLTDDVNPFTGNGEERHGFGVFDDDEPEGFGLGEPVADSSGDELGLGDPTGGEETVSFDDLKGMIEEAADAERAAQEGHTISFDEDEVDDTHVEVQATESVDDAGADGTDDPAGDEDDGSDSNAGDVTLERLSNTYASDLIVFEWLTDLVRTGGPAATLRAISYYHEIGWISDDVKAHLEGVLSGPDLDMHVDPESTPDELTAEDHADSYTYLMKLQEIHETKQEVTPSR
ncbi:FlaD/FlaE family flagellar protein [Natrialbaceae archaeon A-CW3]